ncbi:hypothetical protein QCA50_014794 [Cerrena zonata]|uniref:Uncharacterized protein n=1 Tax=Cerrena zonata TaxID=2478898 RepID=A0AAW0FQ21_9APHY
MMVLLPPEVLFEIVTTVLVDYLENIMPDLALIRQFTLETPLPPNTTAEQVEDIAAKQMRHDYFQIVGPYERNHFAPLLQTSYQIREIALSVLSDHLRIPRVDGRLSVRPWPCIHKILQLYTNPKCTVADVKAAVNDSPILNAYGSLICMEWTLWHTVQLHQLGIAYDFPPLANGLELLSPVEHGSIPQKLQHRAIMVITRGLVYALHCVEWNLGNLLKLCDVQQQQLPHSDSIHLIRLADKGILVLRTLLKLIREYYLKCALTPDEMAALPLDVDTEVLKDDLRSVLYPTLVKITEGARRTPEYEVSMLFTLQILQDMKQVFYPNSGLDLTTS